MRSDHAHFRSLNAAILKMQSEDYQTLERHNQLSDAGQHRSERDTMEKKSNKIYGKDGRVEHESVRDARRAEKKAEKAAKPKVKKPAVAKSKLQSEDYQTPERARQTYNTGQEGSKQDTDEKRSKKVYGKDGKVVHASLANMRRSLNKKNKKVAESVESVESAEYTELLESVLLALCEELELDPNELLEDYQTPERAKQTDRLRMRARKTAQSAARKYEQAKSLAQYEKESPKTYGSKGRVVKPTKKMLKTRSASQKAQETKRVNAGKKYREWDNARKETERKNLQTPQGRAIRAASIAQGQRNDLGW